MKGVTRHLKDARPAWITLAGILSAWFVGFLTAANLSDQVLYFGTILELLGLALVALGIAQLRAHFGRPSVTSRILKWFGQIPELFRKPKPVVLTVDSVKMTMSVGTPTIKLGRSPTATVDQRLERLERDVDQLDAVLQKSADEQSQRSSALSQDIQSERSSRESALREIRLQIEEISVGGVHLESIGLVWLLLGTLGTSIPDELAVLIGFFINP